MLKIKEILDYVTTHNNAILNYRASDIVLASHSDTSYLRKSKVLESVRSPLFYA